MKAMIFAAGLGTRLKPLTNDIPKALVELRGKTLLESVIKRLVSYGVTEIIVNVHHFSDKVIDFLHSKDFGVQIHISDESDQLLDTGGGLKKAADLLKDKHFIIYNVDVISDIDLNKMMQYHIEHNALATLAVKNRKTSRYFLFDDKHQMIGWKNMKTNEIKMTGVTKGKLNALAFSGIHIVSPKIFDLITEEGKFSITDVYLRLSRANKILGYQCEDSLWMDLGKIQNLSDAEEYFKDIPLDSLNKHN